MPLGFPPSRPVQYSGGGAYVPGISRMKNRTKFNVKCIHCGKRSIVTWRFQFDVPTYYESWILCDKCGKKNVIGFRFTVTSEVL